MKIPPVAERDAARREFIETHSYFDERTGELYAPDDIAPPEIYDPEGDEDSEEDLHDEDEDIAGRTPTSERATTSARIAAVDA